MKKNDILLLVLLIAFALSSFLQENFSAPTDESFIKIQHGQKIVKEIPLKDVLTKETLVEFPVKDGIFKVSVGPSTKVLVSPCPNKACMETKAITKIGESIICVPEEVIVSLQNPTKAGDLDAVIR